ncbi:MAG: MBL fold metallo-hydrolase [Clostridium sp.]
MTWLGHSTLLIQLHGLNILIDPLFSKRTFSVNFAGPKRFSELPITIEEVPEIDLVIISHDHYDHMDMDTIKKLDFKVKKYIVPLGVEKHLKRFKVEEGKIKTMAWWEEVEVNGLTIGCTPAKHYSNRQLLDRGNTLYASWVLKDEYYQIYVNGDTGFGGHFSDIHERYGDFDFVMMDSGQYNSAWHDSHMFPEEAALAVKIMGAKISMPIHFGAFALSRHGWDDPPERFVSWSEKNNMKVVIPRIGETMEFDRYEEFQEYWWRDFE